MLPVRGEHCGQLGAGVGSRQPDIDTSIECGLEHNIIRGHRGEHPEHKHRLEVTDLQPEHEQPADNQAAVHPEPPGGSLRDLDPSDRPERQPTDQLLRGQEQRQHHEHQRGRRAPVHHHLQQAGSPVRCPAAEEDRQLLQ